MKTKGTTRTLDERRLLRLLWAAAVVQVLGRALDLRWHATHDEFEGTAQQLEAHWLLWLGVLATLAVAALGARMGGQASAAAGFRLTLAGCLLYVPTAVWHFVEHANHNDPEAAHVLLGLWQVAMLAGVLMATVQALRAKPASA